MPQTIKAVEIFAVGTWNGLKFTADDLVEIASNTEALLKKHRHRPPVKMGHDDNQTLLGQEDGDPALGWVENIRAEGDKLLADFVMVPDIVVSAIQNQLFRQVSVELRHIDHLGWLLTAVALVGADLPAVTTLDDLQAFLTDKPAPEATIRWDASTGFNFTMAAPHMIGGKRPQKPELPNKDSEMDEKKFAAMEAENQKLKEDAAAKDGQLATMTEQAKVAEEQRAAEAFTAGKTAALAPYEQRVKNGKLMPATFEKLKAAFDQQKDLFAATNDFMVPTAINFEMGETMPKGEGAADGKTPETSDQPDVELAAIVEQIAFDKGLPHDQALRVAFKQNPDLAQAYKRQPAHTVPDWR